MCPYARFCIKLVQLKLLYMSSRWPLSFHGMMILPKKIKNKKLFYNNILLKVLYSCSH